MLLYFCVSLSAQITFEDFSSASLASRYLQLNGSTTLPGTPPVLRLTDGVPDKLEGSTAYFDDTTHVHGLGKQPVAGGFTTWFAFDITNLQCCSPGDGIAFIIQNSTATDSTYGATGLSVRALGAGGNPNYPNQAGAMGYAGINNNLVIEFDVAQDLWDPNNNHIAIQTCGPQTNTPVHEPGDYTIGYNESVQSCLLNQSQQSIDTMVATLGGTCGDGSCIDGTIHNVVIGYTPPAMGQQQGLLQIWLDPTFVEGTHIPRGLPTMSVPYNIVYDAENNPSGLQLDSNGAAWVGFTASQPMGGSQTQDVLGWEFTLHSPVQIQEPLQPGGTPTMFAFGAHETDVTYPMGFQPNGILMTVTATPIDRQLFYQTRLAGTQFANEQCIVYGGAGGGNPPTSTNGNCIVYTYTCQDQNGNGVTCPMEPQCPGQPDQCIAIDTSFSTMDKVTATNADYLENDVSGDNNWMSIFVSFQNKPFDGTTSGRGSGFGGTGSSGHPPAKRKVLTGVPGSADIVATFNPSKM
jgi:hypothetical protein